MSRGMIGVAFGFTKSVKEEMKARLPTKISNKDTCRSFSTTPIALWGMAESFMTMASKINKEELDKAENKGTGIWSSIAALKYGEPSSMISSAVNARFISNMRSKRIDLSNRILAILLSPYSSLSYCGWFAGNY